LDEGIENDFLLGMVKTDQFTEFHKHIWSSIKIVLKF